MLELAAHMLEARCILWGVMKVPSYKELDRQAQVKVDIEKFGDLFSDAFVGDWDEDEDEE